MTTATDLSPNPAAASGTTFPVIPFLRYADPVAAVGWLTAVLGFAVQQVHPSADDVQHAELRFGPDGLIMFGPLRDDALALRSPRALGGTTQGSCLVDAHPDATAARILAAGWEVLRPLADTAHGSRELSCRDPEGHLWTVGTYRVAGGNHLTPGLLYEDAPAAIDWLERAFGLERALVVPGEAGRIVHAELRCGGGAVMLGSDYPNDLGLASGRRLGGVTQGIYVPVKDVESHHRRATAAGATLVFDLADMPYGSREYTCRDLEGNLWSFGTYLA